jgi:hypothetical protein
MISDLLGSNQLVDLDDLTKLVSRLVLDLVFVFILVRLIYYRLYRNREYVFTYFLFNIITLSLCLLLRKVPIELGFALGLFAVFGILRYRTEPIRIRDLTYLFIVIGLGILNAVANKKISVAEMVLVNAIIVGATAWLELRGGARGRMIPMLYDNVPLLSPGRERELYADLTERTGFPVKRVELVRVDLLRDSAEIIVYEDPVAAASASLVSE